MYVCLCNALTDCELRAHATAQTCSVEMVYRALGVEPLCGKCVPFVRQMLQQVVEQGRAQPAGASVG
jgi:bacterioferritin-associated ferredoxin